MIGLLVGLGLEHLPAWLRGSESLIASSNRVAVAVYILAFIAGGRETLLHTISDLRRGVINIDLLMLAAAAGAAALGDWPEGAVLLFLFSLSHALEDFILGRTRRAIAGLMELTPDEATLLHEGGERRVPVEELAVGDVVVVRPSERIPVDGVLEVGFTSIDQSPMTGESIPVDKSPGDIVFGGTLNQQGLIHVRVTRIAGETTLARMVQLVEQAQTERAASQRFTEWFGPRYTWLVLGGSLAYFLLLWLALGFSPYDAFYRSMAVLVVASPCAVVLSIPAAILTAITSAASGGVLFKGGVHLEDTALLKTMAFDKTGTLTRGRPELVGIATAAGISEEQLLKAAVAIEQRSEHPLARAITQAAETRGYAANPADEITSVPGFGVTGKVDGHPVQVGKALWFEQNGPALPSELAPRLQEFRTSGQTVIAVVENQRFLGLLAVADTLRPTAASAIGELKGLGIAPLLMLTGDSIDVARDFAGHLGLEFQAELLPEDKLTQIERLRRQHGSVGMVGDGMNDAPALALANVGFSLGGAGTDVALETADVVIMADDLRRLPYAVTLARRTQRIIRQNLTIAFGVMGTLLLVGLFFELPLPLAVLGHEGSTVLVILNGLRLLAHPRPEPLLQPG